MLRDSFPAAEKKFLSHLYEYGARPQGLGEVHQYRYRSKTKFLQKEYTRPPRHTTYASFDVVLSRWMETFEGLRPSADQVLEGFAALIEESALPENWDGDGALPVSGVAAAVSGEILFRISRFCTLHHSAKPENIVAPGNGGLFMDWDFPHKRLELFINPVGVLTLVEVTKIGGDDAEWDTTREMTTDRFISSLKRACNQSAEGSHAE